MARWSAASSSRDRRRARGRRVFARAGPWLRAPQLRWPASTPRARSRLAGSRKIAQHVGERRGPAAGTVAPRQGSRLGLHRLERGDRPACFVSRVVQPLGQLRRRPRRWSTGGRAGGCFAEVTADFLGDLVGDSPRFVEFLAGGLLPTPGVVQLVCQPFERLPASFLRPSISLICWQPGSGRSRVVRSTASRAASCGKRLLALLAVRWHDRPGQPGDVACRFASDFIRAANRAFSSGPSSLPWTERHHLVDVAVERVLTAERAGRRAPSGPPAHPRDRGRAAQLVLRTLEPLAGGSISPRSIGSTAWRIPSVLIRPRPFSASGWSTSRARLPGVVFEIALGLGRAVSAGFLAVTSAVRRLRSRSRWARPRRWAASRSAWRVCASRDDGADLASFSEASPGRLAGEF